jgi:ABC-2 type transport system permease protein
VQQVLSAQPTLGEDDMRPSLTQLGPPVSVTTEPLFNRSASYKGYVFPAVAVIIAQQTLLFGAATMLAGMPRRAGRASLPATFVGTWLALASLGCLATLFLFGMGFWLQEVPRSAISALLIVSVLPFSAAVAALGMLAGTFMDRPERAVALLAPTSVPIFFLSGVAWPLDQMPAAVQLASHLLPSTVGVHLFVATNQMNAGLHDVYLQIVQMTSLCVLFASVAYLGIFKQRLALA